MAERTSNLISSYKSYISGDADEEAQPRAGGGGGGVQYRAGSGQQPLMRDWSREGTVDRYGVESVIDDDDRSYEKKYRYAHPFFKSRRFRYVSAVAVLTAVIVLVSGGVRRHRRQVPLVFANDATIMVWLQHQPRH